MLMFHLINESTRKCIFTQNEPQKLNSKINRFPFNLETNHKNVKFIDFVKTTFTHKWKFISKLIAFTKTGTLLLLTCQDVGTGKTVKIKKNNKYYNLNKDMQYNLLNFLTMQYGLLSVMSAKMFVKNCFSTHVHTIDTGSTKYNL